MGKQIYSIWTIDGGRNRTIIDHSTPQISDKARSTSGGATMRIERRPRVKKPDVEPALPAPMLRDRDREPAAFAEGATDEGVRPGIVAVGAPVMRLLAVGAAWLVAVYKM